MIVFHASTVQITNFYIPYGGLHLGGMHSALECALRKVYTGREAGIDVDTVYIHRCFLKALKPFEADDMGSDASWKRLNQTLIATATDFDCIKYTNKYEVDVVPSYCLFDASLVEILDCSTMHMDMAEDILHGTYTDDYRYEY
ncbi:hypothetical protein pEaSNUABM50_00048 [Erwinia phage pEa_SNUABM_50]|uniref:Uncharacterized protein n=4 Tax=Eneladusvirus BF TaxID=2560751 RepID=A0A7L8ZM70_9CAUD|nr:hypothetical protein FDH34_gp050 [Serratia phage BF]QOI70988.1 hypothetical protein pEaSNUABM12_00050 [Erwinia phage pEa_SNUABM_12]QOI71533.1 hypothetical protein pEaSNUABM47_00049 [Erwinia phage pEa_SNUABM_47]QOI72072.1 hypothetical protein pEaSNUABM50_00048 [Erwinia phage pEa_SNUABM_50]QXO11197.1 hypothetical protein pEaSNUABM19_00051 [Erwinia phage pEa_SNUABM_19]QXO12296.1 hypothetical protein pEaSNUABM49_00050 [Erwinia phage pEa_SNUABM_49]